MMTSADSCRFDVRLLEAGSVIGRNHVMTGFPNQDAVAIKRLLNGNILAVADGVGSDKHSEYASQSAVEAVIEVFSQIFAGELGMDDLAESLCFTFVKILRDKYSGNPSTTCVFCAHLYDAGVYIGQIGDGICCGYQNGEPFVLINKNAEFTNIVEPLNTNCSPSEWKIFHIESTESLELMLATDGIADDILPGKEVAFAHYLIDSLERTGEKRQEKLEDLLLNWETPKSFDDKTIALYHCVLTGGRVNADTEHADIR